jgi:hypothetical protein
MSKRYYIEYRDIDRMFMSSWKGGWQVFDRDKATMIGDCEPYAICLGRNRTEAAKIRDNLNAMEESQNHAQKPSR